MNQGVNPMKFEDVVCRREAGSAVVEGVQQEWAWHNSVGFEWGNGGSGPAYLALNILLEATGDRDFAARHHQDFQVALRGETAVRRRGDTGSGDSRMGSGANERPGAGSVNLSAAIPQRCFLA